MAYKALYNKYRPQNFDEVVGQQGIVRTLKNAIAKDKIAHAYLFSGPRGTGKTTMARLFAKALNCEHGIGQQCDECPNCIAIRDGNHPDVVEIDAASNNGVDQVRELIEKVKYAPIRARYKVYIIDEVHMMSQGAFNALLKTLEEPPEQVIFILATTEPFKILPTILSRCQRFDFSKIEDADIKGNLIKVLEAEGITYEEEALDEIVALSDGGMRDALSTLEQVLAYSGDSMTIGDVLTLFGLASSMQKIELLKLVCEGDISGTLKLMEEFLAAGIDIKRLNSSLLDILKDLLVFVRTGDASLLTSMKESEAEDLVTYISPVKANQMIEVLLKAQIDFRNVSNIRSLFELTMIRLCSLNEDEIETKPQPVAKPVEAKPIQPEISKVQQVEVKKEDIPAFIEPIKKEEESKLDVSSVKESVLVDDGDRFELDEKTIIQIMVLGKDNKEERRNLMKSWGQFETLKNDPKFGDLATLMTEGHPFCLCNDVLLLSFNFTRLKNKANIKDNQKAIASLTERLLGRKVFVYGLDRLDCNKLITTFTNMEQLNKLPNKKDIVLEIDKGE